MEVNINNDESIDDLQLNGLRLIQKEKGFRFGVDAVLLSHFANIKKKHRVIDLCTGTGIVPFLVYGKYSPQEVIGLEIQEDMVEMANRSSKLNDTSDIVKFVQGDLKDKALLDSLGRFDVVTVNPPYKLNNAGILNPNDKLAIGLALGLIFGTLIENIGLGLVIGLIFGSIFKEKNKSDK